MHLMTRDDLVTILDGVAGKRTGETRKAVDAALDAYAEQLQALGPEPDLHQRGVSMQITRMLVARNGVIFAVRECCGDEQADAFAAAIRAHAEVNG